MNTPLVVLHTHARAYLSYPSYTIIKQHRHRNHLVARKVRSARSGTAAVDGQASAHGA